MSLLLPSQQLAGVGRTLQLEKAMPLAGILGNMNLGTLCKAFWKRRLWGLILKERQDFKAEFQSCLCP